MRHLDVFDGVINCATVAADPDEAQGGVRQHRGGKGVHAAHVGGYAVLHKYVRARLLEPLSARSMED